MVFVWNTHNMFHSTKTSLAGYGYFVTLVTSNGHSTCVTQAANMEAQKVIQIVYVTDAGGDHLASPTKSTTSSGDGTLDERSSREVHTSACS